MVTIMHSLYHCSNINNRQNLYCGTYVLYKSYHTSQNKINTVHVLKAKHFFPHPSHSQCVQNGLNDAIQFSNIRQQYRTSGESGRKLFLFFFLHVKTGVWHQEMCSSSVHPRVEKHFFFYLAAVLLCSCCQKEFTKASIMQNVLGSDLIQIYLRLHIYTGVFFYCKGWLYISKMSQCN